MGEHSSQRYVIVGAGAIGGTIAGVLARAGVDVVVVARNAHLDALLRNGLRLRTPDGTFTVAVSAVSGPSAIRLTTNDVLVFATKAHQLDTALKTWVDQPVYDCPNTVGTAGD